MARIKALLNETDVTTDFIEEFFDNLEYVESKNRALGFCGTHPFMITWTDNVLDFTDFDSTYKSGCCLQETVRELVDLINEQNENIVAEADIDEPSINRAHIRFYFKE